MTGKDRIRIAMLGGKADRVPFMPQICFPHAVLQLEDDYEAGIIKCIEDPRFRIQLMFEITKLYESDGFRMQSAGNEPLKVHKQGDAYIVVNENLDQRVGTLNLQTGGIEPDEYPIKTIEDVKCIRIPAVAELLSLDPVSEFV